MLAILFLIIAGALIGYSCHWGMLAVASFVVVVVRVAYHFYSGQFIMVDVLMLAASLCALQGGFILGGFIAYKRDI
ncbi:hypothetical protein [Methylorubrum zatmanii]|uniref:Uncharacterized protein n=1 Tax=Methylorubrum zatmanii TaxID=29429 RepID=A0ABW1WZY4_9HYPH|nr:hypothetical protein [Methylorubrum zatmanii]MBD8907822.1 hypothetical protein [Methylorubrum zatmanii]